MSTTPVPRPAASLVPPGTIRIFDTTLRDGEQAPGAGLTAAEKLEVARALMRLKVDVIEAGFPAASPGDWEAVHRIAKETKGGIAVAALARCRDGDPQRAIEAIEVAERPHLHVFIATSDIHLKHKLRMDRETALAEAIRWVSFGRQQDSFGGLEAGRPRESRFIRLLLPLTDAGLEVLEPRALWRDRLCRCAPAFRRRRAVPCPRESRATEWRRNWKWSARHPSARTSGA